MRGLLLSLLTLFHGDAELQSLSHLLNVESQAGREQFHRPLPLLFP